MDNWELVLQLQKFVGFALNVVAGVKSIKWKYAV